MISIWIIWLIAAAILLIIEMLIGAVAACCVAVGCLVAAIVSACGCSPAWQVGAACIGTVVSFIVLAPILKKYYRKHSHHVVATSNMDALIGRTGRVTQMIPRGRTGKGRVQIDGDNWLALTSDTEDIYPEDIVKVESYDSIVIFVTKANKESI